MTTSNYGSYGGGWIRDALLVSTLRKMNQDVFFYSTFFKPFIEDKVRLDGMFFSTREILLAHNMPKYYKLPLLPDIGYNINEMSSKLPYLENIKLDKFKVVDVEHITARIMNDLQGFLISIVPQDIRIDKEYEILNSILCGADGKLEREVRKLKVRARKNKIGLLNSSSVIWSKVTADVKDKEDLVDIATIQGYDMIFSDYAKDRKREILSKLRENVKQTDGFIAVSKYYAKRASSDLGISLKNIDVVYNGVDTCKYRPVRVSKDRKKFTIMFLGRIDLYKGLLTLVFAAKHMVDEGYDNFRICVTGSVSRNPSYFYVIRDYISLFDMDDKFDIVFDVPQEKKIRMLNMSDVVVYPTVHPEPFGLVPVESMACGMLPKHGAFTEIVKETKGGLLFRPNDSLDLAKKIIQLMEDKDLQGRLSEEGLSNVKSKFSAEVFARNVLNVYERFLD